MKKSPSFKQKIAIVYHANCPDGFGSAWAAWMKFKDKAVYLPAEDRFAPPGGLKGKQVYIIDYSYPPETMRALMRENISVTGIDHHVTARESIVITRNYSYEMAHSGAVLAWKYFHPKKPVPQLLRYIEDRDLWNWKLPSAREVIAAIDTYPRDFTAWRKLATDLDRPTRLKYFVVKGKIILAYEEIVVKEMARNAEEVRFEGYKIFAVNGPKRFADQLGDLLSKGKNRPFAIVWIESEGRIKVSLRSRHYGMDISRIAQKYGGGGHKESAAFSFEVGKPFPWKRIVT